MIRSAVVSIGLTARTARALARALVLDASRTALVLDASRPAHQSVVSVPPQLSGSETMRQILTAPRVLNRARRFWYITAGIDHGPLPWTPPERLEVDHLMGETLDTGWLRDRP